MAYQRRQERMGTESAAGAEVLVEGELGYITDVRKLRVGDGAKAGGYLLTPDNLMAVWPDQTDASKALSLAWWIARLNGAEGTIRIPSGTHAVLSDVTVPANVCLRFDKGAVLSVASGKTLTINGPISAGLWQIFGGAGTVTGSPKISEAYAAWFGAVADGTTDSADAIQTAIEFIRPVGNIVRLCEGIYVISHSIELSDLTSTDSTRKSCALIGKGKKRTFIKPTISDGSYAVIHTQTLAQAQALSFGEGVKIKGLTLDGSNASSCGGIKLQGTLDYKIKDVDITAVKLHGLYMPYDANLNISIAGTYASGSDVFCNQYASVKNSRIRNCGGWGFRDEIIEGVPHFEGCLIVDNALGGTYIASNNSLFVRCGIGNNALNNADGAGVFIDYCSEQGVSTHTNMFLFCEIDTNKYCNVKLRGTYNNKFIQCKIIDRIPSGATVWYASPSILIDAYNSAAVARDNTFDGCKLQMSDMTGNSLDVACDVIKINNTLCYNNKFIGMIRDFTSTLTQLNLFNAPNNSKSNSIISENSLVAATTYPVDKPFNLLKLSTDLSVTAEQVIPLVNQINDTSINPWQQWSDSNYTFTAKSQVSNNLGGLYMFHAILRIANTRTTAERLTIFLQLYDTSTNKWIVIKSMYYNLLNSYATNVEFNIPKYVSGGEILRFLVSATANVTISSDTGATEFAIYRM